MPGEKYPVPTEEMGRAYGFFDCSTPREGFEGYLSDVRTAVETPPEVELYLREGDDFLRDDYLRDAAMEHKDRGFRYALEARYPRRSNKDAANEVATNLNQLSLLVEDFDGIITYREGRDYVLRE